VQSWRRQEKTKLQVVGMLIQIKLMIGQEWLVLFKSISKALIGVTNLT